MKAVVLRLDPELVEQIDQIRSLRRLDRTAWLRTAVDRSMKVDSEVTAPYVRAAFGEMETEQ